MRFWRYGRGKTRKRRLAVLAVVFLVVMIPAGAQAWSAVRLLQMPLWEEMENADPQADAAASAETESLPEMQMIRITRDDRTVLLSVEDYLPGIIAVQMSESGYAPAVWQCQAVIARTYVQKIMKGRLTVEEEELPPDISDELLNGAKAAETAGGERAKEAATGREELAERLMLAEQAVSATAGVVMKYEGEEILPLFHAMSAGQTRSGGEEFPYLVSTACPSDCRQKNFSHRILFTWEEFAERLRHISAEEDARASSLRGTIQIIKRDSAGYVEEVQIGGHVYTGDELRFFLGLPSAHFSVAEDKQGVQFTVLGSGHGYGLSQSGAQAMAETEASYEEILNYFYHDIMIEKE